MSIPSSLYEVLALLNNEGAYFIDCDQYAEAVEVLRFTLYQNKSVVEWMNECSFPAGEQRAALSCDRNVQLRLLQEFEASARKKVGGLEEISRGVCFTRQTFRPVCSVPNRRQDVGHRGIKMPSITTSNDEGEWRQVYQEPVHLDTEKSRVLNHPGPPTDQDLYIFSSLSQALIFNLGLSYHLAGLEHHDFLSHAVSSQGQRNDQEFINLLSKALTLYGLCFRMMEVQQTAALNPSAAGQQSAYGIPTAAAVLEREEGPRIVLSLAIKNNMGTILSSLGHNKDARMVFEHILGALIILRDRSRTTPRSGGRGPLHRNRSIVDRRVASPHHLFYADDQVVEPFFRNALMHLVLPRGGISSAGAA